MAAIRCSSGAKRRRRTRPFDEDGGEQRAGEQREAAGVGDRAGIDVHHDRAGQHGRGDQQRVDGEDLGEEGGAIHALR
jgi:hypothetical protein